MPSPEELKERILRLKEERNAVILAHNYQIPDIQDIADFLGDSLALAIKAKEIEAEVIVFCGVDFMAETAAILNPDKTVIIPDTKAKCPLAGMVDAEGLRKMKEEHPDAAVVSYVNTTAETKALSDYCCTSANAVEVVKAVPNKKVIFTPDRNLGAYVKSQVKDKEIILWPGFCATHDALRVEDFMQLKKEHPEAEILAHPECRPEVLEIADHVFSTGGMVKHVRSSPSKEFIVGTEKDMAYRLKKENPDKIFYTIDKAICPTMKKITLENLLEALENMAPVVKVPEELAEKAKVPIERMIEIGRGERTG